MGSFFTKAISLFSSAVLVSILTIVRVKADEEPNCSGWIFNASSEEYAAAFDRWVARTERAQTFIQISKRRMESSQGNPDAALWEQQTEAARILTKWYEALIHVGGLTAMEKIPASLKMKALRHATGRSSNDGLEGGCPQIDVDFEKIPEGAREFYSLLTQEINESGLPAAIFCGYLQSVAQLSKASII